MLVEYVINKKEFEITLRYCHIDVESATMVFTDKMRVHRMSPISLGLMEKLKLESKTSLILVIYHDKDDFCSYIEVPKIINDSDVIYKCIINHNKEFILYQKGLDIISRLDILSNLNTPDKIKLVINSIKTVYEQIGFISPIDMRWLNTVYKEFRN